MAMKFIINEGYDEPKTVEAANYHHQGELLTFVDDWNKPVFSIVASKVVTIERVQEAAQE